MQPSYQQVMVKPGSTPSYTPPSSVRATVQGAQQPTAIAQQQQQQQQPQQQSAVNSGQIVMPQYVGVPQPMYVMPANGRPPLRTATGCKFSKSVFRRLHKCTLCLEISVHSRSKSFSFSAVVQAPFLFVVEGNRR